MDKLNWFVQKEHLEDKGTQVSKSMESMERFLYLDFRFPRDEDEREAEGDCAEDGEADCPGGAQLVAFDLLNVKNQNISDIDSHRSGWKESKRKRKSFPSPE